MSDAQKPDFRPKARRPRGFQDRRGALLKREREIVEKVLGVYEAWGFERLETSAFEYADALGKFLPDQDRPNEGVFALQDDDEQWMSLRYDLTAPLARFVAENFDALPKPYRRCAAGPVWRNEKPGPGRFREFWQCDADTVGAASPAADAEMIAMACAALEAVGLGGRYRLKISTRAILDEAMADAGVSSPAQRMGVLRAVDKADRLGWGEVEKLLGDGRRDESGDFTPGAKLSAEQIRRIMAVVQWGTVTDQGRGQWLDGLSEIAAVSGGVAQLREINVALDAMGVSDAQAMFDVTIVRGLEYYTGAVFEAELLIETKDEAGNPIRFGSVGGGGRYDDLVSRFKGQPIPATGFSIGVSRLAAALTALDADARDADGPIVVLPFDKDAMAQAFSYAQTLREAKLGPAAEVYLGGSGPKAQLKYADKRRAPVAVIVGGDELAARAVTVKDLRAGAAMAQAVGSNREAYQSAQGEVQVTVPAGEMVETVRAMLARSP